MKISAVCPTYGRFQLLRQMVAFWCLQTHKDRELIIVNSNPVPIVLDKSLDPRIRVKNIKATNLGDHTNAAVALATGDLVQLWCDDDWYLPWHMEIGLDKLMPSNGAAWKPSRSWYFDVGKKTCHLSSNNYESSFTFFAFSIKKWIFPPRAGDCHASFIADLVSRHAVSEAELGWRSSYVFTWNSSVFHQSGSVGNGQTVAQNSDDFYHNNTDTGAETPLTPDFRSARDRFHDLLRAAESQLTADDHEDLFLALFTVPIGDPYAKDMQ